MGNELGLQYIMDGNGNYYTLNGSDQLVVARDREEAGVFTLFEAKQRIGAGRKARFYLTIPVEDMEEMEYEILGVSETQGECDSVICTEDVPADVLDNVLNIADRIKDSDGFDGKETKAEPEREQPQFEYNMEHTDWNVFANYYLFLATNVKRYQEDLAKRHSDVEKEICDLLHYVELYDLTDEEGLQTMDMLKDARQRRRDIKDEISRTEFFQKMIGNSANVAKIKGFLTELKKFETRRYYPRQLPELFAGMENRKSERTTCREHILEQYDCNVDKATDVEEMEGQEMDYRETIYDHKENDWLGFAKQQMEFYQNAGQYMMNLRIEIQTIDRSIEDVMEEIEDANYNVTQGYKVFKELKDLRNAKKAKEKELAILDVMTECFDLDALADAWEYNVSEMEDLTSGETSVYIESIPSKQTESNLAI